MSELIDKLQQIKTAKTQIVDALRSSFISGETALSAVVAGVKEATTYVQETSALNGLVPDGECCITPNTRFDSANVHYPNGSGALADYHEYMSYVYVADKDFLIWGKPEDLSTAYASGSQHLVLAVYKAGAKPYETSKFIQRYRVNASGQAVLPASPGKGDAQYPTEDSPLQISAGQCLIFSHDTEKDGSNQNWRPFKWRTSVPFPKRRKTPGCAYVQYRDTPSLSSEHDEYVRVFQPGDDGYVGWKIEHFRKQAINADAWHLGIMYKFDEDRQRTDKTKVLTNTGEVEMAIKLGNPTRVDYIGCKAHGDEITTSVGLSVDGAAVQLSDIVLDRPCETFTFWQRSKLYDPQLSLALSDVTEDTPFVATHDKTLTFSWNRLSIDQNVTWNGEYDVTEADLPMITPLKCVVHDGISSVVTDGVYTALSSYDLPHRWEGQIPSRTWNDISSVTVYGKESGVTFKAGAACQANGNPVDVVVNMRDNGNGNYNKTYFNMSTTGGVRKAYAGDVWTSHAEMKVTA